MKILATILLLEICALFALPYREDAADQCRAPLPELREITLIDKPECAQVSP